MQPIANRLASTVTGRADLCDVGRQLSCHFVLKRLFWYDRPNKEEALPDGDASLRALDKPLCGGRGGRFAIRVEPHCGDYLRVCGTFRRVRKENGRFPGEDWRHKHAAVPSHVFFEFNLPVRRRQVVGRLDRLARR